MRQNLPLGKDRRLPCIAVLSFLSFFFFFSTIFAVQAQLNINFADLAEPDCYGLPGGNVRAVAVGGTAPYSYTWNTGATTAQLTKVTAGTYSVTVVDAGGSIASRSLTILQPELLTLTFETQECDLPLGITAVPEGGVGSYSYHWSTGAATASINAVPDVQYCVTVTDDNNCGTVNCITLEYNPPGVNVLVNDISCPGEADGSLTATPTGGTAPFTFVWSNGATSQNLANLSPGSYTITLTDANGCTASATGNVAPKAAIEIGLGKTDPTCVGDTNGSVSASVAGGTPPYTYAWNTGATTSSITGLGPGTYILTVTDLQGCPDVNSITLEYRSEISIGVFPTPESCPDANDGFLTVTVNNAVGPYTYAWSNGSTAQSQSNVPPGNYSITVTDAAGCQDVATTTLNAAPDFVLEISSTNVTICGGANGTATVAINSGVGPYTYLWSNGATTATISSLSVGTYSVTVTSPNQCIATGTVNIGEPPALNVAVVGSDLVCPGATTGTAGTIVSGGSPPFTYVWSNGANTPVLNNLPPGIFFVTVTDASGCTDSGSITIDEAPGVSVSTSGTPVVCGQGNTGTVRALVIGGVAPFSFAWNNGAITQAVAGLGTGTYTVTVTDGNGCTDEASFTIRVIDDLDLDFNVQNVDCAGNAAGSATAIAGGGDAPYTYLWSTGASGATISNLAAGTYSVTATDANGCNTNGSVEITDPTPINGFLNISNPLCNGDETGAIDLSVVGGTPPYSFSWSNGAATEDINGLPAGNYTVTITDANACLVVRSGTVNEPTVLNMIATLQDVLCNGSNEGAINIAVSGGTLPYTFLWNTGATTGSISGLTAGDYSLTATDANGCTIGFSATVSEPPVLTLAGIPSNIDCNGGNSGAIDISVAGGSPPYTFVWSNGALTEDLNTLTAGVYSVTVTDRNGCTDTITETLVEPGGLNITPIGLDVVCFGEENGIIDLSVSGGTAPYTFVWSNGATTEDLSGLAVGTYTVTVTDAADCTGTSGIVVNEPSPILIEGTPGHVNCSGGNNGTLAVTVSGGTPPYFYAWSNGATTEDLSGLFAGTYTLTLTDGTGCTDEAVFTINEPSPLAADPALTDALCNEDNSGAFSLSVEGGTLPYLYTWSNGATTQALDGIPAGTYTATITDANACDIVVSGTIGEPAPLICSISKLSDVVMGEDGSIAVTAGGGTGAYTYLWSNGQTTAIIDGLNGGQYSVTLTDANGCTTTCAFNLIALAGLGDFVWEDIDQDGIQDDDEPSVPGFRVRLKDAGGTVIDSTLTDMNGFYAFIGLQPDTYSVQFVLPDSLKFTLLNIGNDSLDNDADPAMNGMTQTVALAPGEFNPTLDAGVYLIPSASIGDPCTCLNNSTTEYNGQFSEVFTVKAVPGQTWRVLANEGMYLSSSPAPPAAPIPVPIGTELVEVSPGVYEYAFILVDVVLYSTVAAATNGRDTLSISNICEYPTLNVEELPGPEVCLSDDPIVLTASPTVPGTVRFFLDDQEITVLDPSQLEMGGYDFRAEFTPDDPDECIVTILEPIVVVNTCFAKLGDFVWEDINRNGLQNEGEPGIGGVKVTVTETGVSEPYTDMTTTDATGMYMFLVPPGRSYKVTFEQPEGYIPTLQNVEGDDAIDSDSDPDMLMTQSVAVNPGEMNLTLDAGFYIPSSIAITDPCTCLNNATDENNGQFSEVLTIKADPGRTWRILFNQGMYLVGSPAPPALAIPVPLGTELVEVTPGVYEYPFILVNENLYSTIATNGTDTIEISNLCTYPTLNILELPPANICVVDEPIPLLANPSVPGTVRFYLDGVEIVVFDPAELEVGTYDFRAELTPDNSEACIATILSEIVVTNECLAKIGDYVWHDKDEDGIQDNNEPGIGGVKVILTEVGGENPAMEMTTTDHTGMYMFLVAPGNYKVTFEQPEHYFPTTANAGSNDAVDSDMDPLTLMTPVVTLTSGEMNLTLDAGFTRECINVTDPGAVGYDQYLCGPGNDPEPFVSLAPATGGEGALEYLWMYSTADGPFNQATWTLIPDSNSPTYDPGVLYETTRFARCARREGCPGFLETSIVVVLVGDETVASIFGQSTICVAAVSTYQAIGVEAGADVRWDFGPGAQPRTATGAIAHVQFSSFGTFNIHMTVTADGCSSTAYKRIVVTNNPALCGEGFVINAEITDEATRAVQIDWRVSKGALLDYTVEHSENGVNFEELGAQNTPSTFTSTELQYDYATTAPKQGRNFYRLKVRDGLGNEWYSNVEEVIFYNESKLALLYPNPAKELAILEIFESFNEAIHAELVTLAGHQIQTWEVTAGSKRIELDLSNLPTGVYLLRLRFGKSHVKALKLVRY